jgi:hypothetical protein
MPMRVQVDKEMVRCKSNGKEGIKEKDTELDKSSIKDEINEKRPGLNNNRVKDMVKYVFYVKIDLRKRPFLSRLASYGRHNSDTTSVTPGFQDKTECITIYMELDPGIHIVMHSVLS